MLEAINTWDDYRAKVREFDAVLEHGKAVSAALAGEVNAAPHARYGEQIFVKLLSHCLALRSLMADPQRRTGRELWDLPSLCALARCVVEVHDAFEYIAGHPLTDAERAFRISLWELHDQTRMLKLLGDLPAAEPRAAHTREAVERLKAAVQGDAFFASLPPRLQEELRNRLARNDPPAFHLSLRQRCALSGVNAERHHAVTSQLAQHVHTLPSAMHELATFNGGAPEALRLLAMPLLSVLPFLVRVIQAADTLTPWHPPHPPSRTARTMAAWRALAEQAPLPAA